MNVIVRLLGSFVFAAAMYALPVLTTCSYVFDWDAAFPLTLFTIFQFGYMLYAIIEKAGE